MAGDTYIMFQRPFFFLLCALIVICKQKSSRQARELQNIIEEHCYSGDEDGETCALLQLELRMLSVDLPEIQEVDTLASESTVFISTSVCNDILLRQNVSCCFLLDLCTALTACIFFGIFGISSSHQLPRARQYWPLNLQMDPV